MVGCQIESIPPSSDEATPGGSGAATKSKRVYIMVLAVLAPYRDRGIGSALLQQVLDGVVSSKGLEGVGEVYLHVWEANKEAIAFYERAGFVKDAGLVENYYRKLENPNAVVLRKSLA